MSPDTSSKSITLYFRAGGSEKLYQTRLEPKGAGFVVNFAFGRRVSTLQTGTKTNQPVDYPTALKVYEKLVNEKMAKGYTPGEDGTPYQGTPQEERSTGIFPQLLNAIDQDRAEHLIRDDEWCVQEKFDGKRIMIRKDADQVIGINRKGLTVALPQPVADLVRKIPGDCLLDGEAVGDVYHAFDILEHAGMDLRKKPYRTRLVYLAMALAKVSDDLLSGAMRLAKTASSFQDKQAMIARLRKDNREGVVFKDMNAPYTPGRPASGGDQLKFKFTATASCIVSKANGTKRSVALVLLDGGKRVPVGNVTIAPNMEIPTAGSIVETRYLYAHVGGSLFQPVCLGVRDDVDPSACTIDQLKYRGTGEDEEAEPGVERERP